MYFTFVLGLPFASFLKQVEIRMAFFKAPRGGGLGEGGGGVVLFQRVQTERETFVPTQKVFIRVDVACFCTPGLHETIVAKSRLVFCAWVRAAVGVRKEEEEAIIVGTAADICLSLLGRARVAEQKTFHLPPSLPRFCPDYIDLMSRGALEFVEGWREGRSYVGAPHV